MDKGKGDISIQWNTMYQKGMNYMLQQKWTPKMVFSVKEATHKEYKLYTFLYVKWSEKAEDRK